MARFIVRFLGAALLVMQATLAAAQNDETPVLVVDFNRMVSETNMGMALLEQIETRGRELQTENERIFSELRAEEQALAAQRVDMSVEDFQAAATDFDERVQTIRDQQDQKQRAYEQMRSIGSDQIIQQALPVLREIMQSRGADVVLQTGVAVVVNPQVDITEEAIGRLDALSATRVDE